MPFPQRAVDLRLVLFTVSQESLVLDHLQLSSVPTAMIRHPHHRRPLT